MLNGSYKFVSVDLPFDFTLHPKVSSCFMDGLQQKTSKTRVRMAWQILDQLPRLSAWWFQHVPTISNRRAGSKDSSSSFSFRWKNALPCKASCSVNVLGTRATTPTGLLQGQGLGQSPPGDLSLMRAGSGNHSARSCGA